MGTIAEELTRLTQAKENIKIALVAKGATVGDEKLDVYPAIIDALPTGGSVSKKTVNFLDYDGALIASYTLEEAQALTELPTPPTHGGLTFQKWNLSLEDVNALTDKRDIGANYITSDGKTRIYITLAEGRTSPMLGIGINGTCVVDWGDGSEPSTLSGTSSASPVFTANHEYPSAGDYVISLSITGNAVILGSSSTNVYSQLLCYTNGADSRNKGYQNAIQKIEFSSGITSIGAYAFQYCYSLASISIPDSVTSIGTYAFQYCYSLASISIPDSVTSIGTYAFRYCYSLASISIPDSVTSIGTYAFHDCYSLASISIPDSVMSIGASTFQNCYSLRFVDFLNHTFVPSLSNADAFNGVADDCQIIVPAELLDEWKAATNWSSLASKIVTELS